MLEEAYGREINIQFPGNIPAVSMPINQLLYFPHLSGRWIILAKEKCSLTGM
jgi:hypothetical protein